MATRGNMISRIHTELHLNSATAVVNNAITAAIEHYKASRFWFNEFSGAFLISLTSLYTLTTVLSDMLVLDTLKIDYRGGTYRPEAETWDVLESLDYNSPSSPPIKYGIHHGVLRLYPKPDATMTAQVTGVRSITATVSNSSSTVWTNEAEDLIRNRAKGLICTDWLQDPEMMAPWVPSHLGGMVPSRELESYNQLIYRGIKYRGVRRFKAWL
jgi:hypothetical protein